MRSPFGNQSLKRKRIRRMHKRNITVRAAVVLLMVSLIAICSLPLSVFAEESGKKTVRVGWHESPHFITDAYGRKNGYSYEYQRKVAAYTGWEYEYVEGSWTELMDKLKKGEIDLMSDVSYTEERTNDMLFTSIPMGTEIYYIFTSTRNKDISSKDVTTLNGKRIGVTLGSVQKDFLLEWEKTHGVTAQIVEMNCDEEEAFKELDKSVDAVVTMDTYGSAANVLPICKIGTSEFYFAVSKKRPDLRDELDAALNSIQDENKYYNQQLHDKYLKNTETSKFMNQNEKDWLAKHGSIKVGYQDNYLAFCAKDPATGELTGALKDYLDYAAQAFDTLNLKFEPVCFPTSSAAIEALRRGEIDCVFPGNLTDYDAEQLDLVMTPALMRTEMVAVVRASEQKEFLRKTPIIVAVNEGNTNYDIFLADHYPTWQRRYYKDTPAGLDAIAKSEADCVIISGYRFNNISKQCEKLRLTTVYTGVEMDYCFAVAEGQTELYSILSRVTAVVPESVVHTALTYYSTEDVKTSLVDIVKDNILIILSVVAVILLIIADLVLHTVRAEKKATQKENEVKDLNRKAFVDSLTSVRNKSAYTEYKQKLQERLDKEEDIDLAVAIFDCNYLKEVNDTYGHEKGDIYLKNACQLVCKVFDHSPVFRIGGDEFAVFLTNEDFKNRDKLFRTFEQKQHDINLSAENKWDEINIAFGMALFDPDIDDALTDTINRADKAMYDYKAKVKAKKS